MGFSWQKYWNNLPFPPPWDPPEPGVKPASPASPAFQVDSLPLSYWGSPNICQVQGKFKFFFFETFWNFFSNTSELLLVDSVDKEPVDKKSQMCILRVPKSLIFYNFCTNISNPSFRQLTTMKIIIDQDAFFLGHLCSLVCEKFGVCVCVCVWQGIEREILCWNKCGQLWISKVRHLFNTKRSNHEYINSISTSCAITKAVAPTFCPHHCGHHLNAL